MNPEALNRPIPAKTLAYKMQKLRNFALPALQAQIEAEPRLEEALGISSGAATRKTTPAELPDSPPICSRILPI